MKPIVIEVRENKIVMDVSEFKKYIEDAYYQGYNDASSVSTVKYDDPYWWRHLTCNGPTLNATDTTNIVGVLDNSITNGTITG